MRKGSKSTDPCRDCHEAPRTRGSYCAPCHNKRAAAWHHKHRAQQNAKSLAYYRANRAAALATAKANRAAHQTQNRDRKMRQLYGVGADHVATLYAAQTGRCAICSGSFPETGRAGLHVDHDHASGRIRGLLCSNCNQGLGRFRDSAERLRAAAAYLGGAL